EKAVVHEQTDPEPQRGVNQQDRQAFDADVRTDVAAQPVQRVINPPLRSARFDGRSRGGCDRHNVLTPRLLVPTLCVGNACPRRSASQSDRTRRGAAGHCVPTRSVGTRSLVTPVSTACASAIRWTAGRPPRAAAGRFAPACCTCRQNTSPSRTGG